MPGHKKLTEKGKKKLIELKARKKYEASKAERRRNAKLEGTKYRENQQANVDLLNKIRRKVARKLEDKLAQQTVAEEALKQQNAFVTAEHALRSEGLPDSQKQRSGHLDSSSESESDSEELSSIVKVGLQMALLGKSALRAFLLREDVTNQLSDRSSVLFHCSSIDLFFADHECAVHVRAAMLWRFAVTAHGFQQERQYKSLEWSLTLLEIAIHCYRLLLTLCSTYSLQYSSIQNSLDIATTDLDTVVLQRKMDVANRFEHLKPKIDNHKLPRTKAVRKAEEEAAVLAAKTPQMVAAVAAFAHAEEERSMNERSMNGSDRSGTFMGSVKSLFGSIRRKTTQGSQG